MTVACIEDLRQLARRRLPRTLFDFIDGGAQDEVTLRRNREDFAHWALVPRVLTDVSLRDQSVTLFGQTLRSPLILAPTGLPGVLWPDGAAAAARAADAAGVGFCLSTMSTTSIEEIAGLSRQPTWFQVYVMRDREITRMMMQRAKDAGCSALVVTVDLQMQGQRDRDVRNGLTMPPRLTLSSLLEFGLHPGWLWRYATGPKPTLANFVASGSSRDMVTIAGFVNSQFDQSVTWKDIDWVRSVWNGPLALKGICASEDARIAIEHGIDGIIVGNHGGRQLDGAPSPISVLPEVVEAVQGRARIVLDGGVRRGSDVLKALALGADACMIGRPFLYGLASMGGAGVSKALELMHDEIDVNLALLGRAGVKELDRSAVSQVAH
ncbi:MAG: alpha-hydroxy-acid oxidizing protein [Burkholderiales bacterium]|nr:alpha-hydroxy-acid oxidizing protein [Burkholderiales bacterium]